MSGSAPGTPSRPFTTREVRLIRERYPTEGAVKLAQELGRSRSVIISKARYLGLWHSPHKSSGNRRIWTAEQDAIIRRYYPDAAHRRHGGLNMKEIAKKVGTPVGAVRKRAYDLGLVKEWIKSPPWTNEEIEFVLEHAHLATRTLVSRMKKRGWQRSESAIRCLCHRHQVLLVDTDGGYSARRLAKLLGVGHVQVSRWIKEGTLKAEARGETVCANGGPGDQWLITPTDVFRFIAKHPMSFLINNADQLWLLSLLTTRGFKDTPSIMRQSSAGMDHEANGGFEEYEATV